MTDKVVNIKDTAKKTPTKKKSAKKLTYDNIVKEVKALSKPIKKSVTVGGEMFEYEIDTNPTLTKTNQLTSEIRNSVAFLVEEDLISQLSEETLEGATSGLVVASLLKVFTDIGVPTPILERVEFINYLAELNILTDILSNLPTGLDEALEHAGATLEEMTKEIEEVHKVHEEELAKLSKEMEDEANYVEEVDKLDEE